MKKVSIEDFENDFQKLLDMKIKICDLNLDLQTSVNFKKFTHLTDGNRTIRAYRYEDFPNIEIKTIIENFFLKKKNGLLKFYENSISEFKEKYKDIGLDISDRLERLKLND